MNDFLNSSILTSTKIYLGFAEDDDSYDQEILSVVNATLANLVDFEVGKPIIVNDATTTWLDFLGEIDDVTLIRAVNYTQLKSKRIFDPSASATVESARNDAIAEYEYRLINRQGGIDNGTQSGNE